MTHLKESVRTFSPSYFAMVMATGIVSIAAALLGMRVVAVALLWLNVAAYLSIWVMSLLRLALFRREFLEDLTEHKLGPGFFFYNEFPPEADHVEPGITQKVSSSDFHNWRKGFTPEELQKILNFYKDRYKQ